MKKRKLIIPLICILFLLAYVFHLLPFLILFFLIFIDKVCLAVLAVGYVGIELATLNVALICILLGPFWILPLSLLIFPAFDLLKVSLFGGDLPNPFMVFIDSILWWITGNVFLLSFKFLSFSLSLLISCMAKVTLFSLKDKLMGEIFNPVKCAGNLIFIYLIGIWFEKVVLKLF